MKKNPLFTVLLVVLLFAIGYISVPHLQKMFKKKEEFESYKECLKRTGSEDICK